MARRKSTARRQRPRPKRNGGGASSSEYFLQPGKRGAVVVLRKPCGNRAAPKVCGTMPSRGQAKMLITQLEKAESVVNDLFLEATDDGIEALEAVLAACRAAVLKRTGGGRDEQEEGGERKFAPPREPKPLESDELGEADESYEAEHDTDENEKPYKPASEPRRN